MYIYCMQCLELNLGTLCSSSSCSSVIHHSMWFSEMNKTVTVVIVLWLVYMRFFPSSYSYLPVFLFLFLLFIFIVHLTVNLLLLLFFLLSWLPPSLPSLFILPRHLFFSSFFYVYSSVWETVISVWYTYQSLTPGWSCGDCGDILTTLGLHMILVTQICIVLTWTKLVHPSPYGTRCEYLLITHLSDWPVPSAKSLPIVLWMAGEIYIV